MTDILNLTFDQRLALEARAHQIRAEAMRYGFRVMVAAIRNLFSGNGAKVAVAR